jgi:molybdopterin synthase catalytic subunit
MLRELLITTDPIDEARLLATRRMSPDMGAVACFLGVVRQTEGTALVEALDYDSFRAMAEHQLQLLFDQVERRWPVESVRLVHRLGLVRVNEPSLWVEVVAPHRSEAFEACQWLIDQMKQVVPIWKKPLKAGGR